MSSDDDYETFRLSRTLVITAIGSILTLIVLLILLHLYAKYVLRRQERPLQNLRGSRASVSLYSPTTELGPAVNEVNLNETHKTGLDHSTIALLPIFKYKPTDRFDHGEAIECSVCLSAIVEETMVRVLPNCKHMFHAECIDMWLGSHTTCPICRTTAEPRVQPTAPPLVESGLDGGAAPSEKVGGSGSRLSSFRRMMSRERSSSRIQSCEEVGAEDLERQCVYI